MRIQLVQHHRPPPTPGAGTLPHHRRTAPRSSSRSPRSPPTKSTNRSAPSPETRPPAPARRPRRVAPARHLARQVAGAGNVAQPRKQPDRYAHARRTASRRAASSAGFAVAPSIQTSPPSKNSCFQIGTICFTRSITYRHAANASRAMGARRGDDDAGLADRQPADPMMHRQPCPGPLRAGFLPRSAPAPSPPAARRPRTRGASRGGPGCCRGRRR